MFRREKSSAADPSRAVQTHYGPDSVLSGPTTYYVPNAVFVG